MKKLIYLVEKYLVRTIVLSLVLLVIVQGVMTNNPLNFYLDVGERLEGQIIGYPVSTIELEEEASEPLVVSPYALMTITIDKFSALPKTKILINGQAQAEFSSEQIQLKIMAGDVVEIDSTAYNFPVEYKVAKASDNLSFPTVGTTYTANGTLVMVGKVIVK